MKAADDHMTLDMFEDAAPAPLVRRATLYTDGACRGNPGPGGWGAIVRNAAGERELCGGERNTTNNRMELTAAIRGLQSLRSPSTVTVFLDSRYVADGITEWIRRWIGRGWGGVKNVDLWQELERLTYQSGHRVDWRWVRGHNGNPGNERADWLANRGIPT